MTMDELFARRPTTWGLRGDPRLWEAMRERLRGTELPAGFFAVRALLERTFTELTGARPDELVGQDDTVYRPELATGSGMSDGHVSLHYWKFTALPILLDRWAAAVGHMER
ncbi:hypothetical protein [Amycolatopsis aidingensis]|uniref:hypothetical protein n=1 Tax=Amycolatopsis aidingensis TaxID=2842453 RepID=UPI001C0B6778|nr:hypothetical protein [Amycolatopsis aidingensis]